MVIIFTTERQLTLIELEVVFNNLGINCQTHRVTFREEECSRFREGDEWEQANQYNIGGCCTLYTYKVTEVSRSFRDSLKKMAKHLMSIPVLVDINLEELKPLVTEQKRLIKERERLIKERERLVAEREQSLAEQ